MTRPRLLIVIGANGAGKTTWANQNRTQLPSHFYNADSIAGGRGDPSQTGPQREARGPSSRADAIGNQIDDR